MENCPKIRILWIDDRERVTGYPQRQIPRPFSDWFEVVHPVSSIDTAMSYESAASFSEVFIPFWFDHNDKYFPAEIIATDYNLQKIAAADSGPKPQRSLDISLIQANEITTSLDSNKEVIRRDINFDGLLIGTFCAMMTYLHPSALVSITNYPGDMPSEVETLRALVTPFLSVATQQVLVAEPKAIPIWHNLPASDRSWENIIIGGLNPLRKRITFLFNRGDIIIPPRDIFALMDGITDRTITIKSPHATRELPVQGLFCDIQQKEERKKQITIWASEMLASKITREQFENSNKLASTIWSIYNDDVLIDEHTIFSRLHLNNQSDKAYERLQRKFGLQRTERGDNTYECTEWCSDIKSENIACENTSQPQGRQEEIKQRRWAALLLIRKLLKRILVFIDVTGINSMPRDGQASTQSLYPGFEEDDILLLLYPVPTSPFPLPWHIDDAKLRDNKKGAWRKWMKANLGFEPKDILAGQGLTAGERQILQGIAMDDIELGINSDRRLEKWKSYEPARLFLFGPLTSIGKFGNE
jgi:hypothetical protein